MKIQKIIYVVFVACFILTACKTESKKENSKKEVEVAANMQKVSLHISGMTCQIGCAKTIQSKLSKKEGITSAKVVFKDSLATVTYNASKITKGNIVAFVSEIAGGDLYKASEITDKNCKKDCTKACPNKIGNDKKVDKENCKENCKEDCCKNKRA